MEPTGVAASSHSSCLRAGACLPIPSLGRKPFSDRGVKDVLEAIPRVTRYTLRERAMMTV
jgi:hypothetical protein